MAELKPVTVGSFPAENINPKEKEGKDWLLSYARAAMGGYEGLPDGTIGYRSRDKYEKIKSYALGRQDVTRYQQILNPGEGSDADETYNSLVVDWSVQPIIPKFRRIALGLLEKVGYNIVITPIDALAAGELKETLNEMRAKVMLRQALPKAGLQQLAEAPPIAKQPDEPDDLDGVGIMELGVRHRVAMEAEQVVDLVFTQNDWDAVRKEIGASLFDYGVAAVKDDTSGSVVSLRACDMRRMIFSYCTYPDLRDLRYVGEVISVPASQVEVMSGGQVTKSELEIIYGLAASGSSAKTIFGSSFNSWEECYNKGKVQILDLEILSTDTLIREERTDKRGNLRFGKARFDDKRLDQEKFKSKPVQSVYRVKWVVGTDIIFDAGRQVNIKRDPKSRVMAQLSYHIVTSDFHDMRAYSRVEAITPYADSIQLASYKLQHALNTAVPKGIAIDISALEEVSLSAGGSKMTPADVLDLYLTKGVMIFRRQSGIGNTGNQPPFIELQGGVGDEIAEYQNTINHNLDMIRQTLGLNELTDGSTPNPKMLNGIGALAAAGTNNALSDLFYADRKIATSTAESVIIRAQNMIRAGNGETFVSALGAGTVTLLKEIPPLDRYTFGFRTEDRPTDQQEQAFNESLQKASLAGQIDIGDELRVKNMPNLKQRELYLAYKIRKNKEEQQQQAAAQIQQNTQAQIQSAQAAEQLKRESLQLEWQLRKDFLITEKSLERQNLELTGNMRLEGERIAATGRVESSFVQAKERDASNIRTNTTHLIKEGKSDQTGVIDIPAELESRVDPLTSEENPTLPVKPFSFLPEKQMAMQPSMQPPMPAQAPEAPQQGMEQMMQMMGGQEEMPEEVTQ